MNQITYTAIIEEEGYASNQGTEEAAIAALEAAKDRYGRDETYGFDEHPGYVRMDVKSGLSRSQTRVYPTAGVTWSN